MKKLLLFLMLLPMSAHAVATVTIQLNTLAGTPSAAGVNSVRVDLKNCPAPSVPGSGFLNQKSMTFEPNSSGLVTATLFQNSLISCGNGTNSYYTFNFVSNGTVTSLGSYIIPAGTNDLSTLTPLFSTSSAALPGAGCISLGNNIPLCGVATAPTAGTSCAGAASGQIDFSPSAVTQCNASTGLWTVL